MGIGVAVGKGVALGAGVSVGATVAVGVGVAICAGAQAVRIKANSRRKVMGFISHLVSTSFSVIGGKLA